MAKKIRKPAQAKVRTSGQGVRIRTPYVQRDVDREYFKKVEEIEKTEAKKKAAEAKEEIDINDIL